MNEIPSLYCAWENLRILKKKKKSYCKSKEERERAATVAARAQPCREIVRREPSSRRSFRLSPPKFLRGKPEYSSPRSLRASRRFNTRPSPPPIHTISSQGCYALGQLPRNSYMENQGQVNLCICLFVGISLMGFSGFGFCIDSSSFPSKGGTSGQNLDLENSKSGSFGHLSYIMKSYFEKYECLDDSRYKDFVAQELPLGLCDAPPDNLNLVPRLSVLERKLIGEGSHRHLSSSIRISIQPRSIYELSHCNCRVILIERLPCGVFADPFELQHLLHRGVLNDIAVFGDTNLESPSFLSNRAAVEVHMDVGCNFLRQKTEIDIELDIPLHARYQPLNETGYSEVRFGAPDLFLCCSVARKSHNQSCLYMIENDGELHYGVIVWKIPSGKKAHAGVVYVFTFISASFAALLIVLTSIGHSNISRSKSLKQS